MALSMNHFIQFILAVDQLANTILLGWADETISARSWRMRGKWGKLPYRLINLLFFWQDNHCKEAYESEQQRLHLAAEYRELDNDN